MPAITGSSLGYAGSVTETTGKDFWNRIGASKYGVVGSGDLKVSTTTGDRMLLVASGTAWGHNIQDELQTSVSVQLNSVASGSRWDLVVVRRDVTAGTSIEVVQGTGTKALPSLTTTAASHPDQPIALCRVQSGSTTVQEIVDLRCWAGTGGVAAVDSMALQYLANPGAAVHIGATTWRYLPDANGVFTWTIAGSTMAYFAPLSPGTSYSNTGIIQVDGRARNVAISINRTTSGLTVSTTWANLGAVIPVGARTSSDRVFYIPSTFYGNTANYPCTVFVNMQTGVVMVRIQSGTVTYNEPVSFDVNLTAVE